MTFGTVAIRGNMAAPWCTEVHLTQSFEAIGWEVLFLQEHDAHHAVTHEPIIAAKPSEILSAAEHADLFLSVRTWSWPALSMEQWQAIAAVCAKHDTITAGFHLDLLWGIGREGTVQHDPFFRADHLFTADGGHDAAWESVGVNHHWLQPGIFHGDCRPGEFRPRWECDVAFVGSLRGYHGEGQHRRAMIGFLERRYGRRFLRIGDGQPTVRGSDLNDLYRSAKVVVGDSLTLDRADGRYWSDRIPESVGRGAFLLHPRIDAAMEQFDQYVGWWPWGDFDFLAATIDGLLAFHAERDPEIVDKVRRDGIDHARAHHTYARRCATMLDTMGLGYDADALALIEAGA